MYDGNASLAQIRMLFVASNAWPIIPAPLTLFETTFLRCDCRLTRVFLQFYLTNNTKCCKLFESEAVKKPGVLIIAVNSYARLLIACNLFLLPQTFKDPQDLIPQPH